MNVWIPYNTELRHYPIMQKGTPCSKNIILILWEY